MIQGKEDWLGPPKSILSATLETNFRVGRPSEVRGMMTTFKMED